MIVVTGGSGHIGNVLVRHLLDMGLEVGVIDRDPSSDPAISNLPIKFFQGDIRDKKFLLSTFKQADFVCHLAGVISIVSKKRKL
ncbi:NAD-dependent epimerase/dehydratase family protein, partial [Escherichia coli]